MNNRTYLDFDLLIEPGQRTNDVVKQIYRARVLNSPAGQAVGAFKLPFTHQQLSLFIQSLFRGQLNGHLNPQTFGNRLFATLFQDAVGNSLLRSLDAAEREGKGLRIRLRLNDVPELATLPWEYLHSPTDERFLALSGQTPIVRYLELAATEQPLELVRPLRILMVIANPINFPPLDVEYEWEKIQEALFDLQDRGLVEIERLPQATLAQLQTHLRQGEYHVLHFIGHGLFDSRSNDSNLVLVNEKGLADFASASVLGTLLRDHRSLRLAFLNACEGARVSDKNPFAGMAQHLVQQGLPSVIAMQFPVSDKAAITLTHEFYQALADGYPVDAGLGEARKAIFRQGNLLEWGTPVLFMRAPDGRLFEIEGGGEEAPVPGVPPFKGLHYFEEKDAERFFGREKLTAQLVDKLRDYRFLAVIGASGSGKSSLVRAGLIPALKEGDGLDASHGVLPPAGSQLWPVHIITPTARPLESLAASLTAESDSVSATDTLRNDLKQNPHSLHLYVQKLLSKQPASRLLLVVDQFEELFTLCHTAQEREARQAFIDNLMHAVTINGPTVVVITLRADFYAQCAQFEQLRQILAKQQEFIGPMNEDELRRAIEEPARRSKWEFEPGLVDQLLKDVGSEPGALPLLSHALLETWKRRRARTLTFAGYGSAGGIKGAIAKTAEQVFNQRLNQEQQQIARQLFLQLTELGEGTQDTRRRVALQELLPTSRSQSILTVQGVLQTLSNARLITVSTDNAEVAHEALIREWPTLRTWLDEDREGLRIHRQLSEDANEWLALNHDQGALYRGARLANALEWAETHSDQLNSLQRRFLGTSNEFAKREQLAEQERQRRELAQARALAAEQTRARNRLRQFLTWLTVFSIITVVLAMFSLYVTQKAFGYAEKAQKHEQHARAAERKVKAEQEEVIKKSRISLAKSLVGQVPYILETTNDSGLATLLSLESLYLNQQLGGNGQELIGFSLLNVLSQPYFNVILGNHQATIWSVAFSPDGNSLVAATQKGNLHVWDLSQDRLGMESINAHSAGTTIATFAPDGTLASAGSDGVIHLWDITEPKPTAKELVGDLGPIKSLAFSPLLPSPLLAAAGDASTIWVWDLSHPDQARPLALPHHEATVNTLTFSSDGQLLASGDANGHIYLWNLASPPALSFFPQSDQSGTNAESSDSALQPVSQVMTPIVALPQQTSQVFSLAFSPDKRWLAIANEDSTILIYDLNDLNAAPIPLEGHTSGIASLDFNSDGTMLASGSFDLTIRLWDFSNGPSQATSTKLSGHADYVYTVAFSPNDEQLASGSLDWVVRLWNLAKSDQAGSSKSSKMISAAPTILEHDQQRVWSVAFSADGKHMASGSEDGKVRLWPSDVISNPSLQPTLLLGHEKKVESLAFHPNKQLLASASGDKTIRLWDINKPDTPIALLAGHKDGVTSVAFSPDGNRLASSSYDNSIRLWNMKDSDHKSTIFVRQESSVLSVAFGPDGKRFASASQDGTISLWDLTNPDSAANLLKGHTKSVDSITFSPDGKWLASGSRDNSVRLWDLTSADPNKSPILFKDHGNWVNFVAFTPDGKRLISAAGDRTIRLWDPTKPKAKAFVFIGHTDWVRSFALSPDGETLASSGDDGTVRLWIARIDRLTDLGCQLARRNLSWGEWQRYLASEPYRRTCSQFPPSATMIQHLIKKAKELARGGDLAQASVEFESILQLQPERELLLRLDPNFEWNPPLDAERYAEAYELAKEGEELLKKEQIEAANKKFYEAIDLDPTLKNDLQLAVKALAPTFVQDGQEFAELGQLDNALAKFDKARQLDADVPIPADAWHTLCQLGTDHEYTQNALRACNEAIRLEPQNGPYYQSRSIVRQLTGDSSGALEDLQIYIKWQEKQE